MTTIIKSIYRIIIILGLFMFYNSCDSNKNEPVRQDFSTESIKVKIEQPIGEMYNAIKFLPLPANVAQFNNIQVNELECWILSKKIKKSKKIDVNIFALIQYQDESLKKNIILAIPTDPKYQTIKTKDLMDFSISYSGVKNILEAWLKNYKGTKHSVNIKWKEKQEALRLLQKYTEINKLK